MLNLKGAIKDIKDNKDYLILIGGMMVVGQIMEVALLKKLIIKK